MRDEITSFIKRKETAILGVILLAALVLRLRYAYISGMWVDEGRYALIGTALLEHPLKYMSPYHGVVTNYPPVFPYLLWLSMTILGWGKTAVYSVSPVMATLGIIPTYFLAREMFGEHEGLIAAAFLAFSPVYFFLSERILIGVTLTALYTASMLLLYYGLEDRRYSGYALWALGPVTALALLTKQPAYLMGPIFAIYFFLKEGKDVLEVREDPMKYRHLYIGALLGLLTLAPWFIRNISICGSIFCSSSKAVGALLNTNPPDWANTGGPFYYFTTLPVLVSLPVAALLYLRYTVVEAVLDVASKDARRVALVVGPTALATVVAFFTHRRVVPFILLLGLAALQSSDEERLLWLWIAFGVGFMSIMTIKVPRYVVFVIPALVILTAKLLVDARNLLEEYVGLERKWLTVALALLVLVATGYAASMSVSRVTASASGFQELEPAGRWFQGKDDAKVLASSPRQLMFYSRNGPDVDLMSRDVSEVNASIRSGTYDYVVVDMYERTRSDAVQAVMRKIGRTDALVGVKVVRRGRTPAVVIYGVNATS